MSTGTSESTRPVKPPTVNMKMNPMANSIGVSKVIDPFHIVATQLKTFTAVGTAISIVTYMKKTCPAAGMPTVNMWCAQSRKGRIAIEAVAYTMDAYANSGLAVSEGVIGD